MRSDDPDRTRVSLVDPAVGTIVADHYRIELGIAAGGFGAIYRAVDLHDGDRDVAIKLLHPNLTQNPAVAARFRREGGALQQLHDPHTVTAIDVGEMPDGTLYIVMELLQGENLYETFKQLGPLPWRRVVAIARAVCSSLSEAHALGIVHRDLKPANIHLEPNGDVKVLDFGIAKIIRGDSGLDAGDLTQAGHMIGTFDYMPPEQMVGGECTGQTDIFTLGVVMYEMVTGVRPFGDHDTSTKMLAALLSRTAKPLAQFVETPLELDRIIRRCLGRKPQQRYATIDDLAFDLDALLASEAGEKRTEIMMAQLGEDDIITPVPGDEDVAITPRSDIEDVLITPPPSMDDVLDSLDGKTVFAPPPIVLDESGAPRRGSAAEWQRGVDDDEPEVTVRKPRFIETRTLPGIIAPKKK